MQPSPVVLIDADDSIERVIVPASAWAKPREVLQVGRRLRIAGHCDFPPKPGVLPVAFHVDFIDVH